MVDQPEVHEFWDRSWRRDLADAPDRLDGVVAQLVGREQLNDRVVAVTDLVVREEGRVVAAAQLRVDGATAAVDSVMTDPAARGPRATATRVLARGAGPGRTRPGATWWCWRRPPRLAAALVRPPRASQVVGSVWSTRRRP